MDSFNEKLNRSISQIGFAALAINGLIGAGIFALPAAAAEASGHFSPWMFVICGLLMSPIILSFAQLSSYFRGTGGPIVYAHEAFGPATAFQTGWLLYIGRVTALAANSNALVFYLATLWPVFNDDIIRSVTITLIILLLSASNLFGIRSAIETVKTITLLKLLPLLLFTAMGINYLDADQLFSTTDAQPDTFSASLLLLVYAFIGFEGASIPAGEARKPQRDIPRALIQTLLFTTVLYFLIQSISMAVLENPAASDVPLADAAEVMFGGPGAVIMVVAAIVSISGNLAAIMLAAPRMTYALSIEKSLPAWFGNVENSSKVPRNSIYFITVLSLVLALTGSFVWLAIISSLARLIGYGICIAAIPVIDKKAVRDDHAIRLPGGLLIPFIAFGVCCWLASQANLDSWLLTGGFIILGTIFYFIARTRNRSLKSDP